MPSFTAISKTAAAPAEVFRFIVTLANWPAFRGFGPLPGITEASTDGGAPLALGSRVRVCNTDGSIHHEVVTAFEPPARYAVRMELGPPASRIMRWIDEDVRLEPVSGGTCIRRRFQTRARSWITAPLVWLVTVLLLRPAVRRHDRAVAAALGAAPRT